ncbi:MAG: hypothetical protein JRH11_25065 [Deltaproteobacteria bacterium]|nr:hypothetical protein [Deltaproteobacteria bacterium]
MPNPKIYINVPMDDANRKRIEREEHFWTAPKLVLLAATTLLTALIVLYAMSSMTTETYWDGWLTPAGVEHELEWENQE